MKQFIGEKVKVVDNLIGVSQEGFNEMDEITFEFIQDGYECPFYSLTHSVLYEHRNIIYMSDLSRLIMLPITLKVRV